MSKYTKTQLKDMALVVLEAKRNMDIWYITLLMGMCGVTGLDPQYIENKIVEFSRYKGGNSASDA